MITPRAIADALNMQVEHVTGVIITNKITRERKLINEGVERTLSCPEFHTLMHPEPNEEKVNVT